MGADRLQRVVGKPAREPCRRQYAMARPVISGDIEVEVVAEAGELPDEGVFPQVFRHAPHRPADAAGVLRARRLAKALVDFLLGFVQRHHGIKLPLSP